MAHIIIRKINRRLKTQEMKRTCKPFGTVQYFELAHNFIMGAGALLYFGNRDASYVKVTLL